MRVRDLGWLLFLCAPVPTQVALDNARIERIEAAVAEAIERARIPGLAIAIGRGGEIRYAKGFGLADVENGVAVRADTRFRTASVAKPMTAIAAMQLVAAGRLSLDGSIRAAVPYLPEHYAPITLEHLLRHASGVRHYARPGESEGTASYSSVRDSLAIFVDDELRFAPGADFSYSTFAFSVIGCAIEEAAGATYEEVLRERVWQPAGMTRTGVDHHFEVLEGRARGYMLLDAGAARFLPASLAARLKPGTLLNAPLHDTSMKVPGGGLVSTAPDLVRLALAMLDDRLVDSATRERMWTPVEGATGRAATVGLSWFRWGDDVGHTGGQAGTTCVLRIRPASGIAVAVMTNLQGAATVSPLANSILDLMDG